MILLLFESATLEDLLPRPLFLPLQILLFMFLKGLELILLMELPQLLELDFFLLERWDKHL